MKNKNVQFVVGDISTIGGVEKVTRTLAEQFVKRGAKLFIYSLYSKNVPSENLNSINIINLGLTPPDYESNLFFKIKRLITNGLILRKSLKLLEGSNNFVFQGFYIAAYIPFIKVPSHSTIVCEHNTYNAPGRLSRLARLFIYRFFSPRLVVLTESDAQRYLSEGVKSVSKIANPSPFPIIPGSKAHDSNTLISLGRFTFQKRFDVMINLSSEPLKKKPEWNLIIQGTGEDLELMKSTITKSGVDKQISILPAGDPTELYKGGSVFLMTSKFEGLPMTLIEAMSFGIPAVCYNCSPGMAEIIQNGFNGFLIEMDDSQSFIDKVRELMENSNLRREMGNNALQTAQKFAVNTIVSDWEKFIK